MSCFCRLHIGNLVAVGNKAVACGPSVVKANIAIESMKSISIPFNTVSQPHRGRTRASRRLRRRHKERRCQRNTPNTTIGD